ncbi:Isochorismatase hydrolase [Microthyrium microscopicum]|uniref:Isochorismatase hydrolase n=1 Tax=Microthyrium microscopicum TaxID=703497 RepID=A0A6A6UBI5_9PEZI|nr:Isochorismatase hydrolase [Microthyrium microscopicum]
MPSCALFVIDIQKDLAAIPETRIPDAQRVCDAASKILDNARAANAQAVADGHKPDWLIAFVQHEEKPESGPLVKDTEPWELVFQPQADEMLIAKNTEGAFESNPSLAKTLRDQGIKCIVICGIQSECCVLSTSKNVLDAGFAVTILKGAHSTYNGKTKTATDIEREVEQELSDKGAKVVDWEQWYP